MGTHIDGYVSQRAHRRVSEPEQWRVAVQHLGCSVVIRHAKSARLHGWYSLCFALRVLILQEITDVRYFPPAQPAHADQPYRRMLSAPARLRERRAGLEVHARRRRTKRNVSIYGTGRPRNRPRKCPAGYETDGVRVHGTILDDERDGLARGAESSLELWRVVESPATTRDHETAALGLAYSGNGTSRIRSSSSRRVRLGFGDLRT
jgi:hypothetical protein